MKRKNSENFFARIRHRRTRPSLYFGFPVDQESEDSPSPGRVQKRKRRGERGIALMIAIMIVAIVMGFMSDMIISSSVNVELALGHRDRVKSEYMAKSGQNLALFLTSVDWGMDMFMASRMKKTPVDGLGDMWTALNGLPIGGASLEMMAGMQEKFDLSSVMDSGVIDQMKHFDGQFVIDVSDESSKINVNYCHKGRCTAVLRMLEALMSCPAEAAFLGKKQLEAKEIAFRIKDYVDYDKRAAPESGFSDEDRPYQDQEPRYRAKNAPLETIDELKMVAGWDDEMHAVFSNYLTVFPFQKSGRDVAKLNINTAAQSMLACLLPEGLTDECREKFLITMKNQWKEKSNFAEGGGIDQALKELACYEGGGPGTKKDSNKSNWFQSTSKVFRFNVNASVGNQSRRLVMVIERLDSQAMKKKKVKTSYNVLYWKLM